MAGQSLEIIPAIDLKGGVAVRARKGLRQHYAPIVTPLAKTCEPQDVISGLLVLHPFRTIYIADLDRIEGRGSNEQNIDRLSAAFPDVDFWVDAGVRSAADARAWLIRNRKAHLVLGSETLESDAVLADLAAVPRILLSLDNKGGELLGPNGIWGAPQRWPGRVIAMSLSRVGANTGPDFDCLEKVGRQTSKTKIYAAGGLRDARDLLLLNQSGASGVLVASALHDGRLSAAELAPYGPQAPE